MIQTPISEENKHIEEYLSKYFERPDTEYAVMINGPWGTGKTWFIKKIKEKYKVENQEILYVSLNGMAKTAAIDAELFRAMHPILGHDATKLLARLGTTLFKVATKVDLNRDGEQETLTISVPTIDTSDLVKNGKKAVLIFDDLERCEIKLKETLGYINYFVEQTGLKVVIVSDESKIKDDEYYSIKEKLIGTTFLLEGSYKAAIDSFLKHESFESIRNKLTLNKEVIYDVYRCSGSKNLRSIKQALQDFNLFYEDSYFNKQGGDDLFKRILQYFIIFSIEVRAGNFKNGILNFEDNESSEKKSENINGADKIFKKLKYYKDFYQKYNISESSFYVFDRDLWSDIIILNKFDKVRVEKQLIDNYYSLLNEKPDWLKLIYLEDLTQKDFDQAIDNVKKRVLNQDCQEIGEIKHIIGLLHYFETNGLIDLDLEEYKEYALENARKIFENTLKDLKITVRSRFSENDSWSGYSYTNKEDLVGFFEEINELKDSQIIDNLKNSAPLLLNLINNEKINEFYRNLVVSDYAESAVLNEISKQDFCKAMLNLGYEELDTLKLTLSKRYEVISHNPVYCMERVWFSEVIDYLKNHLLKSMTGVQKFRVSKRLLPSLETIKKEADTIYKKFNPDASNDLK